MLGIRSVTPINLNIDEYLVHKKCWLILLVVYTLCIYIINMDQIMAKI